MSATNAVSERSFSAARRIKMCLRSARMSLSAESESLDVGNNFVTGNDHRNHVFGTKFNCLIDI